MHILFIERQFPAHFGQVARRLVRDHGHQCTFVCEQLPMQIKGFGPVAYVADFPAGIQMGVRPPAGSPPSFNASVATERFVDGIRLLEYPPLPELPGLENSLQRGRAAARAILARKDLRPDLIVGSALYASKRFLGELGSIPIINYFDYYYQPGDSFLGFRPDYPPHPDEIAQAHAHNSAVFADLEACDAGYSPSEWQRSLYPAALQHKIETIFDGVDQDFWYRRISSRRVGRWSIPAEAKVVTYVARGFESMRGFDIFMGVAKRLYQARSDVLFVVVGSDEFAYGNDRRHTGGLPFREHVLRQDTYDLSRFLFTGRVPSVQLVEIFSLSDLHIYLTAPFVPSWSLFDAMACGCTILASDTSPLREFVGHEQTCLLGDFFDVDGLARQALRVLADPEAFRSLAQAGAARIDAQYSLSRVLPRMIELYERVVSRKSRL